MCPGIKGKRLELILLKYNMIFQVRDKTCPTLKKIVFLVKTKKNIHNANTVSQIYHLCILLFSGYYKGELLKSTTSA